MTNQITIPRETFDAMRKALESSAVCIQLMSDGPSRASWGDTLDIIDAALAAANAVSEPIPDASGHVGFQEWWDSVCDQYEVGDFKKMRSAWNAANAVQPQAQGEASTPDAWLVSTGGKVTAVICEDDADAWLQENGAVLGEPENNPYGPYRKRPLFEHPKPPSQHGGQSNQRQRMGLCFSACMDTK